MYRYVAPGLVSLAAAAVHTVQVGESGLVFVPQTVSAVQGDTVVFELFPGHNVVEGEFDSPCQTDDDDCMSAASSSADLIDADICIHSLQWTVLWYRQRREEVCSERHKQRPRVLFLQRAEALPVLSFSVFQVNLIDKSRSGMVGGINIP
jgi:hypothetical protein